MMNMMIWVSLTGIITRASEIMFSIGYKKFKIIFLKIGFFEISTSN